MSDHTPSRDASGTNVAVVLLRQRAALVGGPRVKRVGILQVHDALRELQKHHARVRHGDEHRAEAPLVLLGERRLVRGGARERGEERQARRVRRHARRLDAAPRARLIDADDVGVHRAVQQRSRDHLRAHTQAGEHARRLQRARVHVPFRIAKTRRGEREGVARASRSPNASGYAA